MKFRLTPNTDEFFILFSQAASNMSATVEEFSKLVNDFTDTDARHVAVKACERKGDELTRSLLKSLDSAFVTPFDREDIHALAEQLDDVVDDVYHLSEILTLVPIHSVIPELKEQVEVLRRMAGVTVEMIDRLENMKGIRPLIEQIDGMETEGDAIYRRAVARLFSGEFETLDVLKWKDIIESAENAIDRLEDVADTVGSILVKHA
jgi:uncharacterized protein